LCLLLVSTRLPSSSHSPACLRRVASLLLAAVAPATDLLVAHAALDCTGLQSMRPAVHWYVALLGWCRLTSADHRWEETMVGREAALLLMVIENRTGGGWYAPWVVLRLLCIRVGAGCGL